MKFLYSPCGNCPFRNDIGFYLPKERRQEIADNLRSDKTFTCHKTIDYDAWGEAEEFVPDEKNQHCAGVLITMKKNGELFNNFMFRLAVMAKMFDPEKLDLTAPVYENLDEFVNNV